MYFVLVIRNENRMGSLIDPDLNLQHHGQYSCGFATRRRCQVYHFADLQLQIVWDMQDVHPRFMLSDGCLAGQVGGIWWEGGRCSER